MKGDALFKFQDRGDGRGFRDQVGLINWNRYKTPTSASGGVFGNLCYQNSDGVVYYYSGYNSSIDSTLRTMLMNPFSICGWFWATGNANGGQDHILSIGLGNGYNDVTEERVLIRINSGGVYAYKTPGYNFNASDTWHHIIFVFYPVIDNDIDNYGIIKLYVDGIKRNQGVFSCTVRELINNPNKLPYINIGGSRINTSWSAYYYRGWIDDLCLFSGDITKGQDTYIVPTTYL